MLPSSKIIGGREASPSARPLPTPMISVSVQCCVPTGMVSTAQSFEKTVWPFYFVQLLSSSLISSSQLSRRLNFKTKMSRPIYTRLGYKQCRYR